MTVARVEGMRAFDALIPCRKASDFVIEKIKPLYPSDYTGNKPGFVLQSEDGGVIVRSECKKERYQAYPTLFFDVQHLETMDTLGIVDKP